jgi:hypothetical protein
MYVIINNKIELVESRHFYTSLKKATIAWNKTNANEPLKKSRPYTVNTLTKNGLIFLNGFLIMFTGTKNWLLQYLGK